MCGVGVLLRSCPNAQVIAPKVFIPSLVNPKFLISATRAVYGEHFTDNFEPVKPIDKQVIRGVRNKEEIELGKRSLQFLIPENETFMLTFRSEERRVGKECKAGSTAVPYMKGRVIF